MAKNRNAGLDSYARAMARKYKIPVGIFMALGSKESGRRQFDESGRIVASSAGALGWAQLMPDTARGLGVNPMDARQNIMGGAKYLRQQFDRFGTWELALAAYNAGPGNVESGAWKKIGQTTRYVRAVLSMAAGSKSPAAADVEWNTGYGQGVSLDDDVGLDDLPDLTGGILRSNESIISGNFSPLEQSSELVSSIMAEPSIEDPVEVEPQDIEQPVVNSPGMDITTFLEPFGLAGSIGSTVRNPAKNKAVGGAATSWHLPQNAYRNGKLRVADVGLGPGINRLVAFAAANPQRFEEFIFDGARLPNGKPFYVDGGRIIIGVHGGHRDHAHVVLR